MIQYFDAEQTKYHAQKAAKQIMQLSGLSKEDFNKKFEMYCLRTDPPDVRKQMILDLSRQHNESLDLIIIDGIRDLMYTINDEKEATEIVNLFMQLAEELKTHIIMVLHQNKADTNVRGHIGTELTNKAETVISVIKDADNENISAVKCEYARNKPFESFAIVIDKSGLPQFLDDYVVASVAGRKKRRGSIEAFDVPVETHYRALSNVFGQGRHYTFNKLKMPLKDELKKLGVVVGDTKLREYIHYYEEKSLLINRSQNNSYKDYYLGTMSINN